MTAPQGLRFSNSFSCAELFNPSLKAIDAITRSDLSSFFRHSLLLRSRPEVALSDELLVLAKSVAVPAAFSTRTSAVISVMLCIKLKIALGLEIFLLNMNCTNRVGKKHKKMPANRGGHFNVTIEVVQLCSTSCCVCYGLVFTNLELYTS